MPARGGCNGDGHVGRVVGEKREWQQDRRQIRRGTGTKSLESAGFTRSWRADETGGAWCSQAGRWWVWMWMWVAGLQMAGGRIWDARTKDVTAGGCTANPGATAGGQLAGNSGVAAKRVTGTGGELEPSQGRGEDEDEGVRAASDGRAGLRFTAR